MIREDFLLYLWQHQAFDKADLRTEAQESLNIFATGYRNANAGPDFSQAKIKINEVEWVGNVEIHVRASDWQRHAHQTNQAYDAVILHVVWQYDTDVYRSDGSPVPVLCLQPRTAESLLFKYRALTESQPPIACQNVWGQVADIVKLAMLEKCFARRLERKAKQVTDILHNNKGDWEETAYQWLFMHFGFKVNNDAFLHLAQLVPLKLLRKHQDQPLQIEALLYGAAALIDKTPQAQQAALRKEFGYLAKKYEITPMAAHEWKYLRLRPANFPHVRLRQAVDLLQHMPHIFTQLLWQASAQALIETFTGAGARQHLGKASAALLITNAVVPLLAAYAHYKGEDWHKHKAESLLQALPHEANKVLNHWLALGQKPANALESQAYIEWFNEYCVARKCLQCSVGVAILKP